MAWSPRDSVRKLIHFQWANVRKIRSSQRCRSSWGRSIAARVLSRRVANHTGALFQPDLEGEELAFYRTEQKPMFPEKGLSLENSMYI
jgi:hypothetical protein